MKKSTKTTKAGVKSRPAKVAKDESGNKKHREDFEWLLKTASGGQKR